MKKLLLIIISLCFLTGCYNYNELEDLSVVSSMIIDYQDDNYLISLEVYDNKKTIYYDGSGKSISDALESILLSNEKKVYLSHINAVLFTKSVKVKPMVDYFLREPTTNNTFYFVLSETNDIYKEKDIDLGKKIFKILKRNNVFNFSKLLEIIYNDTKDIIIPYLSESGEIESGYIFKDNKPVHEVSYDYVETYKLLDNIDGSNFISNNIEIDVTNANTKIKLKDNKFIIDVKVTATVLENNEYDLNDNNHLVIVQDTLNEHIKGEINKLLDVLIEYDSDIFGFETMIVNKYKVKKDWSNFKFDINVNTHINKKGLLKS